MADQELNEKLAKWAGFTYHGEIQSLYQHSPYGWLNPNYVYCKEGLPKFTNSLDDCFEWLVPKVKYQLELGVLLNRIHGKLYACILTTYKGDIAAEPAKHKEPALALCKAIEQIIDKEDKNIYTS